MVCALVVLVSTFTKDPPVRIEEQYFWYPGWYIPGVPRVALSNMLRVVATRLQLAEQETIVISNLV